MFRVEEISNNGFQDIAKMILNEPITIGKMTFNPRSCTISPLMLDTIEQGIKFDVREDDVWIVTYPKCGTTWAQEMCWLIMNNCDFETAKSTPIESRSPFFEYNGLVKTLEVDTIKELNEMEIPRLVKTHQPIPLLPRQLWSKNPKIIYVCRDPRDAVISSYHHSVNWFDIVVTKEQFLKLYLTNDRCFTPYWDHVLEFWKIRHLPNVLFLTYEEMKKDLKNVVQRTCDFLGKHITDEQMEKLLLHLSFDSMKNNAACQHHVEASRTHLTVAVKSKFRFIRRGIVGSYKDEFTQECIDLFDEWIAENIQNTDFDFYQPSEKFKLYKNIDSLDENGR